MFAVLSTVLFFASLEVLLAICGVQTSIAKRDPFVGFAKHLPLFVEKPGAPAKVVTAPNKRQWFNLQEFSRDKPTNTYRIFCLGGSTTYGRPYNDTTSFCGWLRELLPAAEPSRNWEVINVGGISYASYRVALVLEEIITYKPDLVIVYTGHNEFLEHRTYDETKTRSPTIQRLHDVVGRTRTFAVMDRFLSHDTPESATNLLPAEVATKLDKGVGPDAFTRDDKLRGQIISHFRLNLERIIEIARAAETKIIFVSPAANLRDCSPFKSEFQSRTAVPQRDEFVVAYQEAQLLLKQSRAKEAYAKIETAMKIDDRYAAAHYLRGHCLSQLQRFDEAKRAFLCAREEDVCPLRALSPMRKVLMETTKRNDVPLVDFERIIEDNSPHGIAGNNLFLDHVHPTIEGHRLLALAIVDRLVEHGVLHPHRNWGEASIASVRQTIEGRVDHEANGMALRNLAKVLAWAGKQEEADELAVQAANALQNDANAQYLAGSALIKQGEWDTAIKKLNKVLESQPDHAMARLSLGAAYQSKAMWAEAEKQFRLVLKADPQNAIAHNNLGTLFIRRQRWHEAKSHLERAIELNPRYAKAHHNLGIAQAKQQQLPAAVESMTKAITIDPDLWRAHTDLGNLHRTLGASDQAISSYRQALRVKPDLLMTANSLAWLLATSRDDKLRDGEEALRWALRCGEGTNYDNAGVFNTLAAAYAETGNFEKAIEWQEKALTRAPESMKQLCRKRINSFRRRQPIRE